jgi:hypothetical protein
LLRKSTFRNEWKKLTESGRSASVARQVVWDMLECYVDDVARRQARWPLYWTGFHRA